MKMAKIRDKKVKNNQKKHKKMNQSNKFPLQLKTLKPTKRKPTNKFRPTNKFSNPPFSQQSPSAIPAPTKIKNPKKSDLLNRIFSTSSLNKQMIKFFILYKKPFKNYTIHAHHPSIIPSCTGI